MDKLHQCNSRITIALISGGFHPCMVREWNDIEVEELSLKFETSSAEEILKWALNELHPKVALAFSGQAEDVVILDLMHKVAPDKVRVFMVDTGRLPEEIYELVDEVRSRYGVNIEVYYPDTREVEEVISKFGPNLFYRGIEYRLLCCRVRKVNPLMRILKDLDAWITGLRRDQYPTRAITRKIQIDHDHYGILKISPICDWTWEEVWGYIKRNNLPYCRLYDRGFTSIGCEPCTRPTFAKPGDVTGEELRKGRWWWERDAPKECGMHCSLEAGTFERHMETIFKLNLKKN